MLTKQAKQNGKHVRLTSFKRGTNGKYLLALKVADKEEAYQVGVIDRDGIFALDLPTRLALKLRQFPASESKAFVGVSRKSIVHFPKRKPRSHRIRNPAVFWSSKIQVPASFVLISVFSETPCAVDSRLRRRWRSVAVGSRQSSVGGSR